MDGPSHYREAERLLQPRTVHSIPLGEARQAPPTMEMILQAQVHATLALAGAGVVTIERPDDEQIEVHVNGEIVASANHDEHGWSGMDAVERTALAVARAIGAKVDGGTDG